MHRFQPDEVLSAQLITGFFDRLPATKRLVIKARKECHNDDTDSAAEAEAYSYSLCITYSVL